MLEHLQNHIKTLPNLIKMSLDYYGMYNWTMNIPAGTQLMFENILALLKGHPNPVILEVGTMAGTSLIGMLTRLPRATAYVIDIWKLRDDELKMCEQFAGRKLDNVRDVFVKNITTAGMTNRVRVLDGDSVVGLRRLLRNNIRFDFIYVDGSHTCLDAHSDITLAWELLNKHGVMGIDDYTWGSELNRSLFDRPFEAVNHFLEKYKGEYKLLHKGYRVFLLKTV